MIKIENTEVHGWEPAIRGMRNPMNSWEKSDSFVDIYGYYASDGDRDCGVETMWGVDILGRRSEEWNWECPYDGLDVGNELIGPNDQKLMMQLAKAGTEHSKFRRMIVVYTDITAPLYWWKEFDTYKVGTVANSCSTMHKIHAKEFTLEDFSHEHLDVHSLGHLQEQVDFLNGWREKYLSAKDKSDWWQMIQLLPSSYNQRRTVMMNYENLAAMYRERKDHKLDEWHVFCDWVKDLPFSKVITLEEGD